MAKIILKNIRSRFVNLDALEIKDGELVVLLGPSGSGKTSLLNIISGFAPHQGEIFFDNRSVKNLPPHKRKIGYLFQDLYLFPHMTVIENLKIARKAQKLTSEEIKKKTEHVLELFKLHSLADRFPNQLSGGEKQRVALARAIASEPDFLLLDEPFSHLDYKTSRYLRIELKHLQKRLKITTLFVTHDLQEAKELGDRIVTMNQGAIEQVGSFSDLYLAKDSLKTGFLEKPNILDGKIKKRLENGLVEFEWEDKILIIADDENNFSKAIIWPGDVYISNFPPQESKINCFKGVITNIVESSNTATIYVEIGKSELRVFILSDYFQNLDLKLKNSVYVILRLWCLRPITASKNGHSFLENRNDQ